MIEKTLQKEWFCISEVTCSIPRTSQQGFEKYFSLASEPTSPNICQMVNSTLTPQGCYSYPLLYTGNFPSISNTGKWACPSQIRALPPGQKCIIAAARERLSVCVSPGLHLIEWTRHNMDRSQIVATYNARQSGSRIELSRILVSLEFECFLEKWLW